MMFMDRIARSWSLFLASWRVLRGEPQLLVFPLVSGIASLALLLLMAGPLWITGYFDRFDGSTTNLGWDGYILLFLLGLGLNFVANYCNAALTALTLIRLSGREVSISEAFDVAYDRIVPILGYSLIGASIGVVLRALRERTGIVGRIIASFIGIAWAIATFLVIPVLVVENVGPIEGIKRSGALLKKTWGEQLTGVAGIGLITGVMMVGIVLGGILAVVVVSAMGVIVLDVLAIVLVLIALIAVMVLSRALQGIYTAALYAYASSGGIMPGFEHSAIADAFTTKKSKPTSSALY